MNNKLNINRYLICFSILCLVFTFIGKCYLENRNERRALEHRKYEEDVRKSIDEAINEALVASEAPGVSDTGFQDIKKMVSLCKCEASQNRAGDWMLVIAFKNMTGECVHLDMYSHSGVEQVYPPWITLDEESSVLPGLPDSFTIPAHETFTISCPLPADCVTWVSDGKTCSFSYTVQHWKLGSLSVDGDGDMCSFSSAISCKPISE